MYKRRLEDRIRQLSDELITSQDPRQFQKLAQELREAMSEVVARLRERVAMYPEERRRRDDSQ